MQGLFWFFYGVLWSILDFDRQGRTELSLYGKDSTRKYNNLISK